MASAATLSLDPDAYGRACLARYRFAGPLGRGAFAEVNKYLELEEGSDTPVREVAIKSVFKSAFKDGVNLGAIKELQAMQELSHPNLMGLLAAFPSADRVHLVLEYCVADLAAVIRDRSVFLSEAAVKGFFAQMLRGLAAMHAAGWLHRDLKPENLLLSSGGIVKLADFGHAAPAVVEADRPAYHRVVTLWYRAPELLMRAKWYGPGVDMWSAGCILAELLLRATLFPAQPPREDVEEREQLSHIVRLLGCPIDPARDPAGAKAALEAAGVAPLPDDRGARAGRRETDFTPFPTPLPVWPGCSSLPGYLEMEHRAPQPWRTIIPGPAASTGALDLLSRLLIYDPRRRLTAAEALAHPWFTTDPLPLPPEKLPLPSKAAAAVAAAAAGAAGGGGAASGVR